MCFKTGIVYQRWISVFLSVVCMAFVWSMTAVAQTAVQVRHGEHPTFSRIVFDFPTEIAYQVDKNSDQLVITFDADTTFDLTGIQRDPLRAMRSPSVRRDDGLTIVTFVADANGTARHFRSGTSVIVDIVFGTVEDRAEPQAPTDSTPSQPVPDAAADAGNGQQTASDGPSAQPAIDQPATDTPLNPAEENQGGTDTSGRADNQAPDTSSTIPVLSRPNVPNINDGSVVDLSIRGISNDRGYQLLFMFDASVSAASFIKDGYLWTAFDIASTVTSDAFEALPAQTGGLVSGFETTILHNATIFRFQIQAGVNPVMEKDGSNWRLTFRDGLAKPRLPLSPIKRIDSSEGQQVFIPVSGLTSSISVEDPLIGDQLIIIPLLDAGRGLAQHFRYSLADIGETAQGLVVQPLTDDVKVELFREGVSISNIANLGDGDIGEDGQQEASFARLIDFAAWRIGDENEYRKYKARLLYELSLEPRSTINDTRWKLARFYLGHGRAEEAIGVLRRMSEDEPTLSNNGEFRAVQGVAHFMARRLDEAAEDFAHPDLQQELDADLWRTMIEEARGNYAQALEYYERAQDLIGTYDDNQKAMIQLSVVRAAIAENNLGLAKRELELLNGITLTEKQVGETVYHTARITRLEGDGETALVQFAGLGVSEDYEISARSRYETLRHQINEGSIPQDFAIEELEKLRYAWRGGSFELDVLEDLAGLYLQESHYQEGLEALRRGVTYYPVEARQRRLSSQMVQIFRRLYLDGEADILDPVTAISLFYKFRELTPLGADGDMMIRRLSDRLVSVDLLDRAASLLLYQVEERTEGAARAQIASKLAKIYILDRKPQMAQEIIRATREPRLPDDIREDRQRVEARALIELGMYEEAEVMLEPDLGHAADVLRADIEWGRKDWNGVVQANQKLLGDGWQQQAPLDSADRLYLVRTGIAMTFNEDRSGLIRLRERYRAQMNDGELAGAFDLLTSNQQLSGRELGAIASQIANIEKLQTFMRDYRDDFASR